MPLRFRNDLTQEVVRELLDYDPLTGVLSWKHRDRRWFPEPNSYILWNAAHANKPAFTSRNADGCLRGGIFNKGYLAHRIIWLSMSGQMPELELDHINHNRSDNRWANLRVVTHQQNQRNQALRYNNKTGFLGVFWHAKSGKYCARIGKKHLGLFVTQGEAMAARAAANKQYGYSPGHGRARLLSNQERDSRS